MNKNIYIVHHKNAGSPAWRVKLPKNIDGKKISYQSGAASKSFLISRYKDSETALKKARRWRNKILKENNLLSALTRNRSLNSTKNFSYNNKSGIIGIYINHGKYKNVKGVYIDNFSYVSLCVVVIKKIKNRCIKGYSIKKYGEKNAFLMACRERYKRKGKLIILNTSCIPCLPDVPYTIKKPLW